MEAFKGSGIWDEVQIEKRLSIEEVAILIYDMWDNHWCRGATERILVIAPIMDSVIKAARANGVQIIHSPSETIDFYVDSPYRQKILRAPTAPRPHRLI